MVERSLFSLSLSCTINNLQVADGCVSPSNYVQVRSIVGRIMGRARQAVGRSPISGNSHFLSSPLALCLHLLNALRDQRRVKRPDQIRILPLWLPAQRDVEVTHRFVVFLRLP